MAFKSRFASSAAALVVWAAVVTLLSHRRFVIDPFGGALNDARAERSSFDEYRYVPNVVADGWPECRRSSDGGVGGVGGGRCRWDLCVEALLSCETSSLEGDEGGGDGSAAADEEYASLLREWIRLSRDLDVSTVSACGILSGNLVGDESTSLEVLYGFEAMIPSDDRERIIEGHAESYNRREGNRYRLVVGEDAGDPNALPLSTPLRLSLAADANVSIEVLSMRDGPSPRGCDPEKEDEDDRVGASCAAAANASVTTEFRNDFGERISVPADWIFPTKACSIDGVQMECPSKGMLVLAAMAAPLTTTKASTMTERRRDDDNDADAAPNTHLDVRRRCWTAGAPTDRPSIDEYPRHPEPLDPYRLVPPDVRSNWTDDCDGKCDTAECIPARERSGIDRDFRLLLREMMRLADETNVTAVNAYGSLIASLHRNSTLMRWDKDLDFLIWAADIAVLERFAPSYNARQDSFWLDVEPDWRGRMPSARLFGDGGSGRHLDLWAMYSDGRGAEASSPSSSSSCDVKGSTVQTPEYAEKYVSTPWDWMFPLNECYLEGVRLNCPARGSAVLKVWYHADVREPDYRLDVDTGCWVYAPPPKGDRRAPLREVPHRLRPKRR